jgi:hypothetical protein
VRVRIEELPDRQAVSRLAGCDLTGAGHIAHRSSKLAGFRKTDQIDAGERAPDLLHLAARAQAAQVDDEKTSGLEYPGRLGPMLVNASSAVRKRFGGLLRSELVARLHGPFARTLASRQQLAFGDQVARLAASGIRIERSPPSCSSARAPSNTTYARYSASLM